MKLEEMSRRLTSAKLDLDNACDVHRREPSDQRLGEVLDELIAVVGGLVDRALTTVEDRP